MLPLAAHMEPPDASCVCHRNRSVSAFSLEAKINYCGRDAEVSFRLRSCLTLFWRCCTFHPWNLSGNLPRRSKFSKIHGLENSCSVAYFTRLLQTSCKIDTVFVVEPPYVYLGVLTSCFSPRIWQTTLASRHLLMDGKFYRFPFFALTSHQ